MVAQRLVSLALAAFVASSCVVPVHLQGSVTFAWSIGNASDPTACTAQSASTVHVVVRNDLKHVVEDGEAPCASFRSRYFLDWGWYDASLTLLDLHHAPVSETRNTNAFYVSPRVDTFVEVAFDPGNPPL